ncbi:hypothetical protein PR202_gb29928 [Eleusine coracana subsp. coracana]|uniref:DUF7769 domain-containing protein n=1 Tax=Eleusine coracana subsp. coracana TaxID=191504 RepID=A0AAV5G0M7_ELECO|nr:hypothetical protein PR202_gb29928 [Eleusine coracana subsp. coracana]
MARGFDLNLEPPLDSEAPVHGFDLNLEPDDEPNAIPVQGFDLNLEPDDEPNTIPMQGSRRNKETTNAVRKQIYQTLLARSKNGILEKEVIKQVPP